MWVVLAGRASGLLRRSHRVERGVRWTAGGLLAGFAVHLGFSRASA